MSKKNNLGKAAFEMFGIGAEDDVQETERQNDPEREERIDRAMRETIADSRDDSDELVEPVVLSEASEVASAPLYSEPERTSLFAPVRPSASGKTYIAEGTVFEGKIQSKGDIEIAGEFRGDICSEGSVNIHNSLVGNITAGSIDITDCSIEGDLVAEGSITVSEQSEIKGNISCRNIDCAGRIAGDLEIGEMMSLSRSAWINGNIKMGTMQVERGAKITGNIVMN